MLQIYKIREVLNKLKTTGLILTKFEMEIFKAPGEKNQLGVPWIHLRPHLIEYNLNNRYLYVQSRDDLLVRYTDSTYNRRTSKISYKVFIYK